MLKNPYGVGRCSQLLNALTRNPDLAEGMNGGLNDLHNRSGVATTAASGDWTLGRVCHGARMSRMAAHGTHGDQEWFLKWLPDRQMVWLPYPGTVSGPQDAPTLRQSMHIDGSGW